MRYILFFLFCCATLSSCQRPRPANGLSRYEKGDTLQHFAPKLALKANTYKGSFSDDYNSFYFFRKKDSLTEKYIPYVSRFDQGTWGSPEILPYHDPKQSYTYQLNVPGSDKHIFIADLRTAKDTAAKPNYNFWSVPLSNGTWGKPEELGPNGLIYNYNSQPCITADGTLYFTSDTPDWRTTLSYKMNLVDKVYGEPTLFEPVNQWRRENENWTVYEYCMAPDKSYMIVCIRKKGDVGRFNIDLYISYPKDGKWTPPASLGHGVNTPETENFPYITPDGKFLLFTRAFSQFHILPTKTFLGPA